MEKKVISVTPDMLQDLLIGGWIILRLNLKYIDKYMSA